MKEREARKLSELPVEELERRLRETFFYTDKIDETVYRELEGLRQVLEEKRPMEYPRSAEESWALFLERWEAEPAPAVPRETGKRGRKGGGRGRALLRNVLIAAMLVLLLAGATLAAGPQLWAWVSGWNAPLEPESTGSPIQQALEELGITEPVYPSFLPMDYVLSEAHISKDPLLLNELYTRGDRYISITVTSVTAVEGAEYAREDPSLQEYRVGEAAHYLFSNEGHVTAVWYTESCFVSISGNITTRPLKRIIDSVYAR